VSRLLIAAPLRLEAAVVKAGAPHARVRRTGLGPRRSAAAAPALAAAPGRALAVMGFCGALDRTLRPGDLVVASEVRGPHGTTACLAADGLAQALSRRGLRVRVGPIVSVDHVVRGPERERLRGGGAIAVDMESAWLAAGAAERMFTVVRAVVDTPDRELMRPVATAAGAARATGSLRSAAAVLEEWTRRIRPRRVLLAGPRAACAGVDRAIEIVEAALEARGTPLYVRRQIVHNAHVVAELEARGVVFVHELCEVPRGATVVFSAHGVAPAVRAEAADRGLEVIDATCPLVNKVHAEARRFAAQGRTIVLIGHEGHDEVEGVVGEAPEQISLVSSADAVAELEVPNPARVAHLTQTTLAVDEAAEVVAALHDRFPEIRGPASADICYATQNRQDAVRAIAPDCDRILVVGSANSSNSARLVEVAERAGSPARLIEDERQIDFDWLAPARTVGVTAGASAREPLVQRVVATLDALGSVSVHERAVTQETIHFKLTAGLRKRG
jgi:4-hydroxy-3-methylbut-2-enyl diphosphate reductase